MWTSGSPCLQAARTAAAAERAMPYACSSAIRQGLTLAHFRAQHEDLQHTSLTTELNLSTLGAQPRANLGHMGDKVSVTLSVKGQSKLKLSGNGNECKPLP